MMKNLGILALGIGLGVAASSAHYKKELKIARDDVTDLKAIMDRIDVVDITKDEKPDYLLRSTYDPENYVFISLPDGNYARARMHHIGDSAVFETPTGVFDCQGNYFQKPARPTNDKCGTPEYSPK